MSDDDRPSAPVPRPVPTPAPTPPRSLRVLVVEDEALIGMATEWALGDRGHEVVLVGDGQSALTRLRQDRAFDVLVTDRKMPRMSGDELIQTLRLSLPHLPVVILTAYLEPGAEQRLRALGGPIAILAKPAPFDAMVAAVERLAAPG
jgi:CheY-like chemotaxis protein